MECVCWSSGLMQAGEHVVHEQTMITFYNRDEKSGFQCGKLRLTNHRLFWHDPNDPRCILEIHLEQILNVELRRPGSASRQILSRLAMRLQRSGSCQNFVCGPTATEPLVQFEFEYGGHNEFLQQLNQQLAVRTWTFSAQSSLVPVSGSHTIGIAGIQRKIQDRLDLQDQKITDSFRDLSKLMEQAKDMVHLSNTLTAKISKNNKSSGTTSAEDEDEDTKKLKSYFFNMGIIDNPVTKEASGSKYFKALALEIYGSLSKVVLDQGGIMTLADVYCWLNRARGMAGLVSVEDLLNACKELNRLDNDLKYNVYKEMNLHVLEIVGSGAQNRKKLEEICLLVEQNESLTPYALSTLLHSSLIVAKKLLMDAESLGMLCRDDTHMGLRFFPNLFLSRF